VLNVVVCDCFLQGKNFTDTARYTSINLGIEQSRRDDRESGVYLLLRNIHPVKPVYLARPTASAVIAVTAQTASGGHLPATCEGVGLEVCLHEGWLEMRFVGQLIDQQLAIDVAPRLNLSDADELCVMQPNCPKVAEPQTAPRIQRLPTLPGQPQPVLQNCCVLLEKGKLNQLESTGLDLSAYRAFVTSNRVFAATAQATKLRQACTAPLREQRGVAERCTPNAKRVNRNQRCMPLGSPRLLALVLVMVVCICGDGRLLTTVPPASRAPCYWSASGVANTSHALITSVSKQLPDARISADSVRQYEYFRYLEKRARLITLPLLPEDERLETAVQVGGAEQYVGAVQFVARMQAQLVDLQQAVAELKSESALNKEWLELNAQHTAQLELKITEFKAQVAEVSAQTAEIKAQVAEISARAAEGGTRVQTVWGRARELRESVCAVDDSRPPLV
jgi:hypothetical protein